MKIRQLTLKDAAEVYSLIHISRWDLTNLKWASEATFESTAQFIDSQTSVEKHFKILVVGNIAGLLGIRQRSDHLALGYWLGSWYRGRGIMREAVGMFLPRVHYLFPEKPIQVRINISNPKSLAVVKNNGFVQVSKDEHGWVTLVNK